MSHNPLTEPFKEKICFLFTEWLFYKKRLSNTWFKKPDYTTEKKVSLEVKFRSNGIKYEYCGSITRPMQNEFTKPHNTSAYSFMG